MTSQHLAALAHGEHIRLAQAELAAEIRALPAIQARALVAALLEAVEISEALARLKVRKFLQYMPWIGEHAADKLLNAIDVKHTAMTCKVHNLTDRQRRALADLLRGEPNVDVEEAA